MRSAALVGLLVLIALQVGCASARRMPRRPVAPASTWKSIGQSGQGRAIEAGTFGTGTVRVYLIGGIHGDEPEGQGAAAALASRAVGAALGIVRDANPDGTALRTRGNAAGRDLNRNWPARNFRSTAGNGESPLSEPESAAIDRDLKGFRPTLVIVFHSSRSGPFVNFDGPARGLAEEFVAAARRSDPRWRTVASMGYPTPGSLGSYIGIDRGIPILTIEFRRGQDQPSVLAAATAGVEAVFRAASGGTGATDSLLNASSPTGLRARASPAATRRP